jgi:hypothetical protein
MWSKATSICYFQEKQNVNIIQPLKIKTIFKGGISLLFERNYAFFVPKLKKRRQMSFSSTEIRNFAKIFRIKNKGGKTD